MHQADKALTYDVENTVYEHILHEIHVGRSHVQHDAQNGAQNERDKDLGCQTDFLFLFYFIHLFTPVCRWDMYSLSASCQSGI